MHVGTRETAEEIVGNVVVECYDHDPVCIYLRKKRAF